MGNFAFDTRGATLPPLQIAGVLRDAAGMPVVGATIQIKRAGAIFWQGVSGAGGAFTTPQLSGVNYTVIVTKPGYVTSITNIPGVAGGTYPLEIRLAPLPAIAATQTVTRAPLPSANPDLPPTSSTLLRFTGIGFDPVVAPLDPSKVTIVITHGWKSSLAAWPAEMAALIADNHHATLTPQIVVWDWSENANRPLTGAAEVARSEGERLGAALYSAFPSGFAQRLHFVGHSLGTIVNAYACDYVHGRSIRDGGNPVVGWDSVATKPHVTLLDEAEVASIASQNVIQSASIAWRMEGLKRAIQEGATAALLDWKNPIPMDAVLNGWIDNCISAVGLQRDEAVNVCLPFKGATTLNPVAAHSYAHEWYRDTARPGITAPPIGYGSSYEDSLSFPPTGSGRTPGSVWYENMLTVNDPLDLLLDPNPTAYECNIVVLAPFAGPIVVGTAAVGAGIILDEPGRAVMGGYEAGIEWVGDVGGTVIYKTGQVVTNTKEKVGLWWDTARDVAQDVPNSINADIQDTKEWAVGTLQIILKKQPASAPAGFAASGDVPAFAWFSVQVPADAGMMAFDFTVTGDPSEDRIACAINEQNLFTLPAKFAPDGSPVSTDNMADSAYAGQTVELFFGLSGGTSTDCEVAIDGIRFITIPKPTVAVARTGANVQVKWPAAASGWLLESSTTLTPESWQTEPLGAGVSAESGVLTLEQPIAGPRKFYRLRRSP